MIKKILLFGLLLMTFQLFGQKYTRAEVRNSIQENPTFSIHHDNYIITGIPTNTDINSDTADIKYQISFKQLISRKPLVWDSYMYVTYTQKAFWNIYKFSSPFEEINFNPSVGLAKVIYDKDDRVKGLASVMLNHNSNGRDSIYSRSWNSLNFKYSTALNEKTLLSAELWAPFMYKEGNPDLLDYIGLAAVTVSRNLNSEKLILEIQAKKGLEWDWKGSVRSRLYYNPFKTKNQYLMLEWFAGYAESLIDYDQFTSMVRVGFVVKTNELDFLRQKN
ncbi:phospholipase A [Tamlana sp. 2_MG-2023]|uniref:phospholipase A n=1 Tax=unclassified Tamlana TaxID=2614803 RepID=UPI0026E37532|nr:MULTISPECIES: phospholipase A [unclassified Tamlana]MDO6759503.1 phospholipase A [Tamlana sp. 2_MG-2023]MDO6790358.1 phospholipase A [Tamlana sp. 1_MG-2023]